MVSTPKRLRPVAPVLRPDSARPPTRGRTLQVGSGKEFMASLAKGLAVLRAFNEARPAMSLTEAAAVTGLSRAAARRVLLTLSDLGYVVHRGRDFTLSPLVLELGFSYLSIQSWVDRAEPLMKSLSAAYEESSYAAILHAAEIVIVARSAAPAAIMATAMTVGTRLPAFHTAMGRIQLGHLDDAEIRRRLSTARVEPYTPGTITDRAALIERVKADRGQGFSIVDEELESGLRAIAVPVLKRTGEIVGAINVTAHASRTTRNEMRDRYLPALREASDRISRSLV